MPQHKERTTNHKPADNTTSFRSTSSGTLYKRPSEIVRNREVRAMIEKVENARKHITTNDSTPR